jgi:hypothetical protein
MQPSLEELIEASENTPYHTILEVWRAVLAPVATERDNKVTPQWANRIINTYQEIRFSDMEPFKDLYFDLVQELAGILDEEIDTDEECLKHTSTEEDVERNSAHYLNVLFNWQKAILQHELQWDSNSPDAAIQIGALSEIHKMFFDKTGLTSLLDQINFEFTDSDRDLLASELEELKTSQEG